MAKSPRDTIKVRRSASPGKPLLPAPGDRLPITVEVTRIGRNSFDTADTITFRIPGFDFPVTVNADYLVGEGDE
jgi:hypothetical protein